MKFIRLIFFAPLIFFVISLSVEVGAVKPPLKPLGSERFREMIANSDIIAAGTVTRATRSKTFQAPLETVLIHVILKPEKVLKGNSRLDQIKIEETYQQYPENNDASDSSRTTQESVTAQIAGPAPQVGEYRVGERIIVFLKSIEGSGIYRPLGSGDYDAYFGVFRITAAGVMSDKYQFDETVHKYARSEADFLEFITSILGEQR